jgi:hypothetical protein
VEGNEVQVNTIEILTQSPIIPGFNKKMAFYSASCCWWTSFPEDLGRLPPIKYNYVTKLVMSNPGGHQLPCCPHCKSVLLQAPLGPFIESAMKNPNHYGRLGLRVFEMSHHRNIGRCFQRWVDYEMLIEPFLSDK